MSDTPESSTPAADVFISYSSEDREQIDAIVRLVLAMKRDSVFQDFLSRLWDAEEFYDREHNRRQAWEHSQATRTEEFAHHIVARLSGAKPCE